MRELLRSHEEDIVERVVQRLGSRHSSQPNACTSNIPPQLLATQVNRPSQDNPTLTRIAVLENELARLREQGLQDQIIPSDQRAIGMYDSNQPLPLQASESASGIPDSVEILFPGVERATLVQIIENRFKPTNIYRLLASEKERAEAQRTINIGGIEFEQAERDGKESEYRMSAFFKAWAAYCGILVKLAPLALQGDLATALSIYTMNLYDLLEKYAWEGVKAYHFQFHRKRVASGKSIYQAVEWRQLDSELIASKCFAHPAPRATWIANQKLVPTSARRVTELPIRENAPAQGYLPLGTSMVPYTGPEYRTSSQAPQTCRNWNYHECRSTQCRYQHRCITCGSNHCASQCPTGNTTRLPPAPYNSLNRR